MKIRNLLPFLFPLVLLSSGCSPSKVVTPPFAAPIPAASPVKPAFIPPTGWKTVSGKGFAFAVPKTVSEVKVAPGEEFAKFAAKSEDNNFLLGFDYKDNIKTVNRMSKQIMESLADIDAEVQQIKQVEVDEYDGAVFLAVHGNHVFMVYVFVKDQIGYQISCGTPDKSEAQKMVDACEAIVDTFKFTK